MLRASETTWKTDTGRQRRENEDNAFARAPVFVIADGMGGARAGEVASKIAVETFERDLPGEGSAEERLAECVREANRRIYEVSSSEHEHAGMGTTLTAAYLDEADLAIAHVGDSRAYLFRDDELTRLTRDHSLVGELVERGKLTEEEAAEHPQRSIITRALGPEPDVKVDTWTYPVRPGDVLLLCSDGLTSMLKDGQIADILRSAASLDDGAEELIARANDAGGRDNITVVLFRVEDAGAAGGLEEPTAIGLAPAARASDTGPRGSGTASSVADRTTGATAPPASGRPTGPRASARVPLARNQGRPTPPPRPRRGVRFAKPVAALVAVIVVLFLVGAGGYLASRQLYFVGTNSNGVVTIYRGLPYNLPAGIKLYETFYVSGVPAAVVPADRRSKLLNNQLRSQSDASTLVRQLELGEITR
jgi:serine/threonine protein phosphatase PrpC